MTYKTSRTSYCATCANRVLRCRFCRAGETIARYTLNAYIINQTLYVKLSAPALRADLSMRRQEFVSRLNEYVGNQVIADVRFC